jgi:hypothetical protein
MVEPEDLYEPELAEWVRMTPEERWNESARLWAHSVAMGGSLESRARYAKPFLRCADIKSPTC